MRLDYGVTTRGKSQTITQFQGKDVDNSVLEILQRGVNGPADLARAKRADGFVDRHDAPHLRGVNIFATQDFELRVHHFATSGTLLIDFHFAVEDRVPGQASDGLRGSRRGKTCREASPYRLEQANGKWRLGHTCHEQPGRS